MPAPQSEHESFGQACADVARRHPFKVMTIVGGIFFCAGLAVSLSLRDSSVTQPIVASAPDSKASTPAAATPLPVATPSPRESASTDGMGAPDCDKQTWPYLDRPCLDALAAKSKASPQVRVVATYREAPSKLESAVPKAAASPSPSSDSALSPVSPIA